MQSIGINPKTSSEYNVIIADPSNIERKLLSRFLALNSFKITNEMDNTNTILEGMKNGNFSPDIIFLDTAMLGKDGSQFLKLIKTNFPEIKVIFIISTKDQEAYMIKNRINYYIMKPFLKKKLEEKLTEILSDRSIEINSKQGQKNVQLKDVYIPLIPDAVHKILLFESNSTSGSSELENLLLPDKSLCADLLRVANSSLYGRKGTIKNLQDAITLLGLKTIKNIVTVQAKKHMTENLLQVLIFKKFIYEYSTLTSLISHDIISLLGKEKEFKDIFLLSSFRKMGMNILALNFQDDYIKILNSYQTGKDELINLENSILSLNHIQVGVSVMREWKMPQIFVDVILNQEFSNNSFHKVSEIDRVTRIADILAKSILKLKISSTEESILTEADAFYNPKDKFANLFGLDYYNNIISHPFFELH